MAIETYTSEKVLDELKENTIIFIDIREEDEWKRTGVVEGATLLSLSSPNFIEQIQKIANANSGKKIVISCAAGGRSGKVTKALNENGFQNIGDMQEGMVGGPYGLGWVNKKLPLRYL